MTLRAFYSDVFVLPLPPGHRFPMAKYTLLRERLASTLPPGTLGVPAPVSVADLLTAHSAAYVSAVVDGTLSHDAMRRIGFPWSPEMVERSRRSVGATVAAARAALDGGTGVNLAGGTHHAFADRGEGYCVFNDAAVAVRVLQRERRIRGALIVDCDVHQGNGTARIFRDDDSVFTLDVFGRGNFPFEKEPCDLAVSLDDGTEDDAYLGALQGALQTALERSRPDMVVYVAGADPFVGDTLGRLALSKPGLAARDALVCDAARHLGIPLVAVMAGGYAADVEDTVDIHAATIAAVLAT